MELILRNLLAVLFVSLVGCSSASAASQADFNRAFVGKTVLFKRSSTVSMDFVVYFQSSKQMYIWSRSSRDRGRQYWEVFTGPKRGNVFCFGREWTKVKKPPHVFFPLCLKAPGLLSSAAETRRGDIFNLRRNRRGPFALGPSIRSLDSLMKSAQKNK